MGWGESGGGGEGIEQVPPKIHEGQLGQRMLSGKSVRPLKGEKLRTTLSKTSATADQPKGFIG